MTRSNPFPVRSLVGAIALCLPLALLAQQGDGTDVPLKTSIFKPDKVEPTPQRIAQIKAPPGIEVTTFATGLKGPRVIAVAPDGTVYVSRRAQGDVLMLKDADGDGRADGPPVQVASRPNAHGLAIHDGKLYLVTVKELFVADIRRDGRLGDLKLLAGDLPDAGQHANRTIAVGPDNMLYLSVGSTCNACNEDNPEAATLLRMSLDGKSRSIFASGLRNTVGFAWHPQTGELWGMDHGIDFLGDDVTPEELNKIERGKRYGWPHVFASDSLNPQSTPPGEIKKEQWKSISTPMTLGYSGHAAPMQLVFYTGRMLPTEYANDAFVTMRGSWNRERASGYEIVRVRFENGQAKSIEPFVTGFLTDAGRTHIARPVGLAQARDGALLMADDANGVIYRIATAKGATRQAGASDAGTSAPSVPRTAIDAQMARGANVPLLLQRPEAQARGAAIDLQLRSPALRSGGMLDRKYSAYADGVSLPLEWTAVPGAQSYVLVVEDPDAKTPKPFVHWLAWNIPAGTTALPEGLQGGLRLTEPAGLMQGPTSRGSVGYFGPKPPVGDSPHAYHFQLIALDTVLQLPIGADREDVIAAMAGHVVAKGELVGRYAQKVKPPK